MPVPKQAPTAAGGPSTSTTDEAVALTLDERGMIHDCDDASENMFGYQRTELVWQHISMLVPQLTDIELVQNGQINSQLRFLCRLGGRFHGQKRCGERFAAHLFFFDLGTPSSPRLRLLVRRDAWR